MDCLSCVLICTVVTHYTLLINIQILDYHDSPVHSSPTFTFTLHKQIKYIFVYI